MAEEVPTEFQEQCILANYLDAKNFLWFHVPNEAKRSRKRGALMKKAGMKSGVPDIMILSGPNRQRLSVPGVAIELKRRLKSSKASKTQVKWLDDLSEQGWETCVAHGVTDAMEFLGGIGLV